MGQPRRQHRARLRGPLHLLQRRTRSPRPHPRSDYARLLASIGINGCTVNNVNADLRILTPEMIRRFARIADAFRPWGVQLALSVDLSSPQTLGGLSTFDPLDPTVIAWWQKKVDEIYALIPDFGGFVVKADSEGRPAPRNTAARPPTPPTCSPAHSSRTAECVLYRGFVYNHHLDWRDLKSRPRPRRLRQLPRARRQVRRQRHHPDQIRPHRLPGARTRLSALRRPRTHQRSHRAPDHAGVHRPAAPSGLPRPHVEAGRSTPTCAPMNRSTPVKEIIDGKAFHQPLGGFVGVVNVGLETNWLAHPLAMANLYGFGKLAWNPDYPRQSSPTTGRALHSATIRRSSAPSTAMQLPPGTSTSNTPAPSASARSPISSATTTARTSNPPNTMAGASGSRRPNGIGMDRTVATGTGYIGQYPPQPPQSTNRWPPAPTICCSSCITSPTPISSTPAKPSSSTSTIRTTPAQTAAADLVSDGRSSQGRIDDERYQQRTHALQQYQAGHAIVWRDAINDWFQPSPESPTRRAASATTPTASKPNTCSSAVTLPSTSLHGKPPPAAKPSSAIHTVCSASATLHRPTGTYTISVAVLRLPPRSLNLHPLPEPKTHRKLARRQHSARRHHEWRHLDALHSHQHRFASRG